MGSVWIFGRLILLRNEPRLHVNTYAKAQMLLLEGPGSSAALHLGVEKILKGVFRSYSVSLGFRGMGPNFICTCVHAGV